MENTSKDTHETFIGHNTASNNHEQHTFIVTKFTLVYQKRRTLARIESVRYTPVKEGKVIN